MTADNVTIVRLAAQLEEAKTRQYIFEDMVASLSSCQGDLRISKQTNAELQSQLLNIQLERAEEQSKFSEQREQWITEVKSLKDQFALERSNLQFELDERNVQIQRKIQKLSFHRFERKARRLADAAELEGLRGKAG
jgi:hypothetical protein